MSKGQRQGVQGGASKLQGIIFGKRVFTLAHQRMTDLTKLNPDLIGASGNGLNPYDAKVPMDF